MRTTEARQLLPDAWGFICPVHTPDGSPCGLLNHLTVDCVPSKDILHKKVVIGIPELLVQLGMEPIDNFLIYNIAEYYTVMLEGCVLGYLKDDKVKAVSNYLRMLKIEGKKIPDTMEIVLVPKKTGGQYPGLFLFIGSARMMRPVWNLSQQKIEMIGTFEQVYLDIAIKKEECYHNVTTHIELSKLSFMSNLANLIPMPDCNQSPRNVSNNSAAKIFHNNKFMFIYRCINVKWESRRWEHHVIIGDYKVKLNFIDFRHHQHHYSDQYITTTLNWMILQWELMQ